MSLAVARADTPFCAITAMAFSLDGKQLAVGTFGQVVLYDTATWEAKEQFRDVADEARSLAYSPDGKTLAIGGGLPGRDGRVLLLDLDTNKAKALPVRHSDSVEGLAFRKDGKALLVCANDNRVSFFTDLPNPALTVLDEHNGRVLAAAFSPKADFIYITGGMDKIVKVWNAKTQKTVVNFDQSESGVTALAFINNDNFVGAALDGRLRWWRVGYDAKKDNFNGNHYRTTDAHKGGVNAMAISADGKRLITGGEDSGVGIWDAESGNRRKDFHDTLGPIYAVAISPDGKMAAAGGRDGKINIWDVEAGKLTQSFPPPVPPAPKPTVTAAKKPASKSQQATHKTKRKK